MADIVEIFKYKTALAQAAVLALRKEDSEAVIQQLKQKAFYYDDPSLRIIDDNPTPADRQCAARRVAIRRYYHQSKTMLKRYAGRISQQIRTALNECETDEHRAFWIDTQLPGVAGIQVDTSSAFEPVISRLRCHQWLTRKYMRIAQEESLHFNQQFQRIGNGEAYATTNDDVDRREHQLARHKAHLSRFVVGTQDKGYKTLAEIMNTTDKRIAELYVFSLGIDALAVEQGKTYMMITLTCPPTMHPNPMGNRSWDRTRARDAYKFLNNANEAVKRRLANKGISFKHGDAYGIIVSEPHQDGCPHLHILMYYRPEDQALIIDEYEKTFHWHKKAVDFSIENPDYQNNEGESAAARGSSYLFKYLSESFYEAGDCDNTADKGKHYRARHISAWRAQIGARAFRTFGLLRCATLWRQCRKLRGSKADCGEALQKAIDAACSNDFKGFYHCILGSTIKVVTEARATRYGDTYHAVLGVFDEEKSMTHRTCGNAEIIDLRSTVVDLPRLSSPTGLGLRHSGPSVRVSAADEDLLLDAIFG